MSLSLAKPAAHRFKPTTVNSQSPFGGMSIRYWRRNACHATDHENGSAAFVSIGALTSSGEMARNLSFGLVRAPIAPCSRSSREKERTWSWRTGTNFPNKMCHSSRRGSMQEPTGLHGVALPSSFRE